MSTYDTLPILLVSAVTETIATSVILELIDNDVTEEYNKEIESSDRVWRLDNKYYRADVRVHALPDVGILAINPNSVEAHIIHITKDEVTGQGGQGGEEAGRRASASGGAWARCHVRVLLADCAAHDALEAWAVAQRAHFVPALEPAGAAPGPFAAPPGLAAARAALHAHAWPNLRRKDARIATIDENDSTASSDDSEPAWEGEGAGESEGEEERAVERAEAFAAALGALSGAAPAPRAGPRLPRAERLLRAEELVTAFCRALGLDPDSP